MIYNRQTHNSVFSRWLFIYDYLQLLPMFLLPLLREHDTFAQSYVKILNVFTNNTCCNEKQ